LVTGIAFSPDGRQLVSCCEWDDDPLRVCDTATGRLSAILRRVKPPWWHMCNTVAFSPDGKQLVSGGGVERCGGPLVLCIWDAATGLCVREWTGAGKWRGAGKMSSITCVAYSPDGATIASGSQDGTVRLWAVHNLRQQGGGGNSSSRYSGFELPVRHRGSSNYDRMVRHVVFHPEGRLMASGSDGTILVWDIQEGQMRAPCTARLELGGHGPLRCMAFTTAAAAGDTLTAATATKILSWPRSDWQPSGSGASSAATTAATPPPLDGGGLSAAAAVPPSGVVIWKSEGRYDTRVFSPDGRLIADWDRGKVQLRDARSGALVRSLGDPSAAYAPLQCIAFSPDGRHLATGHWQGNVRLWDLSTAHGFPAGGGSSGQGMTAAEGGIISSVQGGECGGRRIGTTGGG
jgi:WD40 repeat protein